MGCSDGFVRKMGNPIFKEFDNSHSFEFVDFIKDDPEYCEWKIKQMTHQIGKITRRVKKENTLFEEWDEWDEDEPEWKTAPITAVLFSKDGKNFFCSAKGKFEGSLYNCSFQTNRPIKLLKNTEEQISILKYSDTGK